MELTPSRTALLIVDAQREYFDEDGAQHTPHAEEIRAKLVRLLAAARESGTLVVFVRHVQAQDAFVEGTKGVEIIPDIAPREGEPVVDKSRYSAFVNTGLESLLQEAGVDTVLVVGLMTQYCSVTTARHAHDLDYRVVFVSDANAGPDLPDVGFGAVPHADAMRVIATALAGGVAEVVTSEQVVSRLA